MTGRLQIEDQRAFQERWWRVERVGWVVMSVVVVAALAGMFGGGPGSAAESTSGDCRATYERFARRGNPTRCVLHAPAGPWRIRLSGGVARHLRLAGIEPRPDRAEAAIDEWRLDFERAGV